MLRPFQQIAEGEINQAWLEGYKNVMLLLPTGGGKTVTFCSILRDHDAPACLTVHRQELASQAALTLNREGVPHSIIAPAAIIRQIVALEMETHGRSLYTPRAPVRIAGVNSLVRRDGKDKWFNQVSLHVIDEGHHVLKDNVWGRAFDMFPNAKGLLPTAHAIRADGRGLGRSASGIVDKLVIGPSCRELIRDGWLTDYTLVCPASDVEVEQVPVGPSGEFNAAKLRKVMHDSKRIVGDVVNTYLKVAGGKLGATFAIDIEEATKIAAAYREAGVPAEIITSETPVFVRAQLMKKLRARQILQLVSVDVLGEGVDVPALEVVSMARPTASFQLYAQQFGRGLRVMVSDELNRVWHTFSREERLAHIEASVKPKVIIIDHVGNWLRHDLPDIKQEYDLNDRERMTRKNRGEHLRTCLNPTCMQPYERYLLNCPYCYVPWIPPERSTPDAVDGDMMILDAAALALLRGEIDKIDGEPTVFGGIIGKSIAKNHRTRQQAQGGLRKAMALWAGWQIHLGLTEREAQKQFFVTYGVDVMTACTYGAPDAKALQGRIETDLSINNIVEAVAA